MTAPGGAMRVLVGTDGSDHARAAIDWLTTFPLPVSTQLRVLSVVTLPPSSIDVPTIRSYHQAMLHDGAAAAEAGRAALARRWSSAEALVRDGEPHDEILEVAYAWKPQLIVVGARGLGALEGALLGSVSRALVHHAPCPVLVVKGRHEALGEIVVAVDGSEDSLAAATFCASLPLDRTTKVRLVAVSEEVMVPFGAPEMLAAPAWIPPVGTLEEERRALEGMLSRVATGFAARVDDVKGLVVVGRPAEEIVRQANEPGVDLVVVGARGLGPVGRLFLGSVSERLLHHAACPVLVVKRAAP